MRSLTDNEIAVVSGGDVTITAPKWGWQRLSTKAVDALIEQHAGAAAGVAALIVAFVSGLVVNYVYDKLGGAEGIDQSIEDFDKWVDEKAKELSAATGMVIDDAKCLLKTLGNSGPGGGAPMTCSMTGATGSW